MKTKNIILTLFALMITSLGYSQFTEVLLEGNGGSAAHNFSSGNYTFAANVTAEAGNGICAVCHTPHNAATDLPLWDHATSDNAGGFTLYPQTGTMDATVGQPSGASLLCLGCHDGSSFLDNYGATETAGNTIVLGQAYANFGTDLSDDHPISVDYPLDGVAASQDMKILGTESVYLFNQKVECASCHSMHSPVVTKALLRVSNDDSALCLTCHAK